MSSLFRMAIALAVAAPVFFAAQPLGAQTDFYNLDKDRPLRVEDAFTTKRYAFELQVSPLTLWQDRAGVLRYAPAVEIKHGVLPGLEVSAGAHFDVARELGETDFGLGEVELSALLNLTVETRTLPALGVRVTGKLPLEGDHGNVLEVRGIATRHLFGPVRAHLNAATLVGDDRAERWWAGLALDYVLPFHHTLLLAETYLAEPETGERRIHSTVGARYQLSPTIALDGGVGRSWAGDLGQDWFLTFGLTHEFGVRALMPPRRR